MDGQAANLEVPYPRETQVLAQKSSVTPPLWDQLSLESRKQLAQQLAKMIQQTLQAPMRDMSNDERV